MVVRRVRVIGLEVRAARRRAPRAHDLELDRGGCLRELAATDLQAEVPAVAKISAERALELANKELEVRRMQADAVALELRSLRGKLKLMWIPSGVTLEGDIDVPGRIWVDANSGHIHRADGEEKLRQRPLRANSAPYTAE